jgi:hypothetical protein
MSGRTPDPGCTVRVGMPRFFVHLVRSGAMQRTRIVRPPGTHLAPRCLVLAVVLAVPGCGGDTSTTAPDIRQIAYAPSLEIDITTFIEDPSGIFYKDVVVGQGPAAQNGSLVDIGVQGWLVDGFEVQNFWSPTNIRVGLGQVIKGLDLALVGMRAGGERKVVIPPHLAHEQNLVMVFKLQVLAVR